MEQHGGGAAVSDCALLPPGQLEARPLRPSARPPVRLSACPPVRLSASPPCAPAPRAPSFPGAPPTPPPHARRCSGGTAVCNQAVFLNMTHYSELLQTQFLNWTDTIGEYGDKANTRMVLEESASVAYGGCIGLSDRFISGFSWMMTMGMAAEHGFKQLNRQNLVGQTSVEYNGSFFTLIGSPTWTSGSAGLTPHPDYYSTLLFKRLMGTRVLHSTVSVASLQGSISSNMPPPNFVGHIWRAPTRPGCGLRAAARPSGCILAVLSTLSRGHGCTPGVLLQLPAMWWGPQPWHSPTRWQACAPRCRPARPRHQPSSRAHPECSSYAPRLPCPLQFLNLKP